MTIEGVYHYPNQVVSETVHLSTFVVQVRAL